MKKRSLFAAVAMLIVSALVLTSATYAWFATGGPGQVLDLGGNVANVSAGVFLKTRAQGALWKNELTKDELIQGGGTFATAFRTADDGPAVVSTTSGATERGVYLPMSTNDPNSHAPSAATPVNTIFAYNLEGAEYKATTDLAYDMYEFYVAAASEASDDVEVKLNITGTAKDAARVMVYVNTTAGYPASGWQAVQSNGSNLYFSGSAEVASGTTDPCWQPIVASLGNDVVDSTQDYIVKANDTGTSIGSKLDSATPVISCAVSENTQHGCFTLSDVHVKGGYTDEATSTTYVNPLVRVYVWLEGQDQDCVPQGTSVPGGAIDVDWYFRIVGEAWPTMS